MKTHRITSKATGKVYEVKKLRSPESFYLPVFHVRRAGDGPEDWHVLLDEEKAADTLADARRMLHA